MNKFEPNTRLRILRFDGWVPSVHTRVKDVGHTPFSMKPNGKLGRYVNSWRYDYVDED